MQCRNLRKDPIDRHKAWPATSVEHENFDVTEHDQRVVPARTSPSLALQTPLDSRVDLGGAT